MNRSACTRRALLTRSCSGTKKSASRVSMARMLGRALRRSRICSAIFSTTSFSFRPLGPMAPGSSPPWPGSSATMMSRSTRSRGRSSSPGAEAARVGAGGARATARGADAAEAADAADAATLAVAGPEAAGSDAEGATWPINWPSASAAAEAAAAGLRRARPAWPCCGRAPAAGRWAWRVQVEHQAVPVRGHRGERENLRGAGLLQVEHHAHHARLALSRRTPAMLGSSAATLASSSRKVGLSSSPSMSITRRGGASMKKCFGGKRHVGLQRDARVVGRWPHPHGHDAGAEDDLRAGQQQHTAPARPRQWRRERPERGQEQGPGACLRGAAS